MDALHPVFVRGRRCAPSEEEMLKFLYNLLLLLPL